MALHFERTADVAPGKGQEAMAFAAEVSDYVSERWVNVSWGFEVGGQVGRVHWFATYDDMAQFEKTTGESLADPGYTEIMQKSIGLFLPGSGQDTMVMMM